jgi:hypothetical protein
MVGCAKKPPEVAEPVRSRTEDQQALAAEDGKDQALEQVRLASLALADGDTELANHTLRQVATKLTDFRAEGQFAAIVGAESAKEWKGEPYEKMMAFLYLGYLLLERGDHGNAMAMAKSALLADTGTNAERFRADFLPAYVLKALAHNDVGEHAAAQQQMDVAIETLKNRALTERMTEELLAVRVETDDLDAQEAARLLLLGGIPAGLTARPADPLEAADAALSWATDSRAFAADAKRKDWPSAAAGASRPALKRSLEHFEPLMHAWRSRLKAMPDDLIADLEVEAAFLQSLISEPGVVLFLESGRGPRKVAMGRYGEVLTYTDGKLGRTPRISVEGETIEPVQLDSVTYQATTRGGRAVDGFLKGKAVFKDSSGVLGYALVVGGDIANAVDDSTAAAVLYILGGVTWIAGAIANPRADTRHWELLPEGLWIAKANLPPGEHSLSVQGRSYTVQVPDDGVVHHLIPHLQPFGAREFGTPCTRCDLFQGDTP